MKTHGDKLLGRVLRPAMVVVGKGKGEEEKSNRGGAREPNGEEGRPA